MAKTIRTDGYVIPVDNIALVTEFDEGPELGNVRVYMKYGDVLSFIVRGMTLEGIQSIMEGDAF